MKTHFIFFALSILVILPCQRVMAARLTPQQMEDVVKIAKDIQSVRKGLSEAKYSHYALSIYRASKQYQLDPHLLISIASQETSFREDLPEGKAGELGICQIRKMWVKNPAFLREFPNATQQDLLNANKNFMYAAWILSDLRDSVKNHTIPYWSYYNARKFVNRFKYYVAVNRYLSALKTNSTIKNTRTVAANTSEAWSPEPLFSSRSSSQAPIQPRRSQVIGAVVSPSVQVTAQNTASTEQMGWIPAALRKLNEEERPVYYQGKKTALPSLIRAANELNVRGLFSALPVQD